MNKPGLKLRVKIFFPNLIILCDATQDKYALTFTRYKSTIETLEKGVKYV